MDVASIWAEVFGRITPVADPTPGSWTLVAFALAVLAVVVPPVWRWARIAVTIVHELGHAVSGILVGRRFTGFVVNGDMSGHAVTVGRPQGAGRIISTWAGYPAPAIIGVLLVQIAFGGWSRTTLFVAALALVIALFFARSLHTVAAILISAGVLGATWWWAGDLVNSALVLCAGVFLLLGAWRHLGAVVSGGRRKDDPQQLAELTVLPAWLWNLGYVLVIGLCTWWAWTALQPHVLRWIGA